MNCGGFIAVPRTLKVGLSLLASAGLTQLFALPAGAQTRPGVQVPLEEKSQSRAIVQQLLKQGRIIRSSQVKRGMRGVGRSVFQGIETVDFPLVVLGVLERAQGGGDIVLVKITGGPVVERNSGVISGMSGSPVYINGKLLGAISLGWGFPKEPICGVTPITEMIESSLPDPIRAHASPRTTAPGAVATPLPAAPAAGQPLAYTPRVPLQLAGRRIARMVVDRDPGTDPLTGPANGATMSMRPTTTLLQLSGYSAESLPKLRKMYEPYQLDPIIGPASKKTGVKPVLKPGAAIGVQLVSGDMDQTAIGTVTFRWGNRILGFGHRMFGQGTTSLPMTSAFVQEIFPAYDTSFKLASPVEVLGAVQQDTQFAIGGTIGMKADTIPMTIALRETARQIDRTYRVRVMKNPVLTPQLIESVATEAIRTTLGLSSDKMVRVAMRLEIDGAAPIVRRNYMYANGLLVDRVPFDVTQAALFDLRQSMMLTQANEFGRGSIKRVDLSVDVEPSRKTALIKKIVANRNKLKAGETVQVSVVLEPTDTPGKTFTRSFEFTVPKDAPTGAMRIAATSSALYWPGHVVVGGAPPEPTNLPELVNVWNLIGRYDELLVQASTPRVFLKVDQQKIPNPAPSWAALMATSSATDIGAYNEVETRREMSEYVLDGGEVLSIAVEGGRPSEKTGPATAQPQIPVGTTPPATAKPPAEPAAGGTTSYPPGEGDEESTLFPRQAAPRSFESTYQSILPSAATLAYSTEALALFTKASRLPAQLGVASGMEWITLDKNPKNPPARKEPVPPVTQSVTSPSPAPTAAPTATAAPAPVQTATPLPTPTPTPSAKSLARPASSWVQDNPTEFLQGEFDGTLVTSEGQLQLAPPSKLLATTAEPFVWSIAGDTLGNTFLGTGNGGRILRIDSNGTQTTFYDGPEVAITALTTDTAGNVYAGVTPGGRVYRFAPGGARTLVLNSGNTFVWALEWDDQGRLLVATGGENGVLYRLENASTMTVADAVPGKDAVSAPANAATGFATVPQRHVRAIAVRGADLFIGTGDEGVLYRVDGKDGAVSALYQGRDTNPRTSALVEITAIAAAPEGVYFGTSRSGTLYRWSAETGVVAIYASPQKAIYSLRRTPDGALFAATGDQGIVYRVQPGAQPGDTRVSRVLAPTQLQALTLAFVPIEGGKAPEHLLIGTSNNGAAYRVGLRTAAEGTFVSRIFDAKNTVQWGVLRTTGRGASVETRSGNTVDPDASWSDWQSAPRNDLGELRVASPAARYLQYRVRLTGPAPGGAVVAANRDPAPSLSRIEVVYRTQNSPPQITLSSPRGGEYWNGKESIKWTGVDADSDVLTYRLSISPNDGATWLPISPDAEKGSSYELDTSKWRDGTYRVRVVVSDANRNPDAPRYSEAISLPFVIDNTAPAVGTTSATAVAGGGWQIQATATDALSPISGAEWRFATPAPAPSETTAKAEAPSLPGDKETSPLGTKSALAKEGAPGVPSKDDEWQAEAAADGIFDSRRETITAIIEAALAKAPATATASPASATTVTLERVLEIRVHDASGNTAIVTIALK